MTELFFAEASSYSGLRDAIRARVEQLNISRECLDRCSGLTSGHSGKLLSQGDAKDRKRIGQLSLDLLLPAVGLKMVLVDDREALAKMEPMYEPRDAAQVRTDSHWRNGGRRKAKAKSARVKKPARPHRGAPYLSGLIARG